ncbi:MAG: hypothetical protein QT10_C0011G0009 [archaeon GW2011_AR19]|nr:MAG: hypothetical protein QT10_C0011G0009 [archaeon GW2011_AR19]
MGLFKKKEEKKEFKKLTELPKLPRLPDLLDETEFKKTLPQLPRYPTIPSNDRFSQNTNNDDDSGVTSQKTYSREGHEGNFLTNFSGNKIKEAVSGEKEEMIGADEFVREQTMPEHSGIKPSRNFEFPYKMERPSKDLELRNWQESKPKKSGQVFIKIDKFEESLKIFELTKNKIAEMEKLLKDIKELKEKEERELSYWMAEIQTIKNQTEQVERDIFSKLE